MNIQHRTQTLQRIIELRDEIELDPSWQRGAVWTTSRKSLLIDSILRRYDVPMFYLRATPNSSPYKYEVVDGQQRLRAIWEYIDGDYSLAKESQAVDGYSIAGATFEELPPKLRKRFNCFEIVVGYISHARQLAISEIFSRMQMGVRLNPPELRNALQSGLRHAIDSTARLHPFFHESRIPSARFKHQDYLAHACSVAYHQARRDAKAAQLKDDYTHISDSTEYSPLIDAANVVLDVLRDLNSKTSKRLTQKWMFVDLFYFIYSNRRSIDRLDRHMLADLYRDFDEHRIDNIAEPEVLLEPPVDRARKELYEYIVAFKYAGGESAQLRRRARVIGRRFSTPLGL